VVWLSLTRRLRSCNKWAVALTPVSASNKAVSNSSYSASSICVPVNTVAMLEPVLRSPALSLSSQPCRVASACGGTQAAEAAAEAVPAAAGVAPTAVSEAGEETGAAMACGVGDFLRKKLNMGSLVLSHPFYEIGGTALAAHPQGLRALVFPGLSMRPCWPGFTPVFTSVGNRRAGAKPPSERPCTCSGLRPSERANAQYPESSAVWDTWRYTCALNTSSSACCATL